MAGGKGKSTGGKAGPKEAAGKSQQSHSAKAGLQVSTESTIIFSSSYTICDRILRRLALARQHLTFTTRSKILISIYYHHTFCA